jgi:hypothetical protein
VSFTEWVRSPLTGSGGSHVNPGRQDLMATKNIYQLAKFSRRLPVRIKQGQAEIQRLIKRKARDSAVSFARLLVRDFQYAQFRLDAAVSMLRESPPHRCALPKKQQRRLGLLPAVGAQVSNPEPALA